MGKRLHYWLKIIRMIRNQNRTTMNPPKPVNQISQEPSVSDNLLKKILDTVERIEKRVNDIELRLDNHEKRLRRLEKGMRRIQQNAGIQEETDEPAINADVPKLGKRATFNSDLEKAFSPYPGPRIIPPKTPVIQSDLSSLRNNYANESRQMQLDDGIQLLNQNSKIVSPRSQSRIDRSLHPIIGNRSLRHNDSVSTPNSSFYISESHNSNPANPANLANPANPANPANLNNPGNPENPGNNRGGQNDGQAGNDGFNQPGANL